MNPRIILRMNPTVICTNWGKSKGAPNEPEPLRMNPRIVADEPEDHFAVEPNGILHKLGDIQGRPKRTRAAADEPEHHSADEPDGILHKLGDIQGCPERT
jgi:hypothetical protein